MTQIQQGETPKPTQKEIESAFIKAAEILRFVGFDRWEMKCCGDDLKIVLDIAERLDATQKERIIP